mgnify:CR=1 FL=1
MTHQHSDETVNRFALAVAELLRRDLDPEFADDIASCVFIAGPPLDSAKTDYWTVSAKETGMDVVYLTFELGRERFGPTGVSVFAERWGAVFRWADCVLWAPKDGGPLLVMPKGLNVCFAHDGKALISLPSRPTHALTNGIARARRRLLRAARLVTQEQLDRVEYDWKMAA